MSKEPPRHHYQDHAAWFRNEERLGRQGRQTGSWANTPAFDAEMRRRQQPIRPASPAPVKSHSTPMFTPTPSWSNSSNNTVSSTTSSGNSGGGAIGIVVSVVLVLAAIGALSGGHTQQAPAPAVQQTDQYRQQEDLRRPVADQPSAAYSQSTSPAPVYVPSAVMQMQEASAEQQAVAAASPINSTYVAPTWTPSSAAEVSRISPAVDDVYKHH